MSEEEYIRIPWKGIYEVRLAFLLSQEDVERLTFAEFMELYRLVVRGLI